MHREVVLRKYLTESERAVEILKHSHGIGLTRADIYRFLIDFFELSDLPTEVMFKDLSADQIAEIVRKQISVPPSLGTIAIADSILPDEVPSYFEKAQIRIKGEVWTIHRADRDGFPSNPHAHNYENNYKLHLGNGNLYRRRKLVGQVTKKNLVMIRDRITVQIPSLQLPSITD